ncbi:MAG: GNAT family N-acetyltransferase [Ruminiclostridium sp.]|nr:GNAT family N-acetyltransferase [Ruminiclostridium sp.]
MIDTITVRELERDELKPALDLVWKVFLEYEAPDYSREGVEEFYKSIHDEKFLSKLTVYGAFTTEDNELVGVTATRSEGTHIALFFVDGKYHRHGIGRMMFETAKERCPTKKMTVNSSPYALPIYRKLGFKDTALEQVINGLRFTPMELLIQYNIP